MAQAKRKSAAVANRRRRFPGISPLAWQHPADLEALEAVKKVPALDQALKFVSEHLYEKAFLVDSVGSRVRLGPKQAPRIWNLFREAADILDMPSVPQIFLGTSGVLNAYAFGMKDYTITVHSSLVDLLTEDELMSVLGHELSHIKCQHMLYRSLAIILAQFSLNILGGLGSLAILPLELALLAWSRKAELSCDRGALLVVQDADVVSSALAKLAGMSKSMMDELDMNEIYKQADEYEKSFEDKLITRAFKSLSALQATHPVPIWRAKQIQDWAKSTQYREILAGRYVTMAGAAKGHRTGSGTTEAGECAKCGEKIDPIFASCPRCGAAVGEATAPCAHCGKQVELSWKKCPHCSNPTA